MDILLACFNFTIYEGFLRAGLSPVYLHGTAYHSSTPNRRKSTAMRLIFKKERGTSHSDRSFIEGDL
jgi:hypothetical protein